MVVVVVVVVLLFLLLVLLVAVGITIHAISSTRGIFFLKGINQWFSGGYRLTDLGLCIMHALTNNPFQTIS